VYSVREKVKKNAERGDIPAREVSIEHRGVKNNFFARIKRLARLSARKRKGGGKMTEIFGERDSREGTAASPTSGKAWENPKVHVTERAGSRSSIGKEGGRRRVGSYRGVVWRERQKKKKGRNCRMGHPLDSINLSFIPRYRTKRRWRATRQKQGGSCLRRRSTQEHEGEKIRASHT